MSRCLDPRGARLGRRLGRRVRAVRRAGTDARARRGAASRRVRRPDRGRRAAQPDHEPLAAGVAIEPQLPVVGDWVALDSAGAIVDVLPRRTTISRRAAHEPASGVSREQVIAANVDVVLVVHALGQELDRSAARALPRARGRERRAAGRRCSRRPTSSPTRQRSRRRSRTSAGRFRFTSSRRERGSGSTPCASCFARARRACSSARPASGSRPSSTRSSATTRGSRPARSAPTARGGTRPHVASSSSSPAAASSSTTRGCERCTSGSATAALADAFDDIAELARVVQVHRLPARDRAGMRRPRRARVR